MIQSRKKFAFCSCILFLILATHSSAGEVLTLITPEEAAQPNVPTIRTRGAKITRAEGNGPQINIHSPHLEEPLRIPFLLDITFEASSDKIIDFDTLSIKYLKLISVDLTARIKPYLDNNRLIVRNVKVPQGKHRLQLFIAYTSGEKTTMEILLNVEK
ncbi:MAG: hypothetical protein ACXU9P_03575 [Thermodesulfobacteriota bacterium]